MQVPEHIFREYDVRGVVVEDLTEDTVRGLGRGYATYMIRQLERREPILAVGRDVRPSSDSLRDVLVEGMVSAGARVVDIGVVPTPVLYFANHHLETDGGVMITGSHNPPEYNGFKLNTRELPLSGDEIQEVRGLIESDDFEAGSGPVEYREVVEA
jgi:phosphomannomutase/phosphoglucomutase